MTTKEFLAEICQNAFGDAYQKEIQNMYAQAVAAGNYTEEEEEYTDATDYLRAVFDSNEISMLDEYEHTCADIAAFSAAYGFRAGLLCGFKQFFTIDSEGYVEIPQRPGLGIDIDWDVLEYYRVK